MQNITNRYNERGWLVKVNDPSVTPPADNSKLFSMELKYADGTHKQFNGNIASQAFLNTNATSAEPLQTFTYQYDELNRLISGASTGASVPANNMQETGIGYDELGNIKSLTRDGTVLGYSYVLNNTIETSRLKSISNITTGDYAYDANGNMTTDARNNTGLPYNLFNLPVTVTKTGVNLAYTYNAAGLKIRKVSNVTGTTDYISGIVYNTISTTYRIDYIQTEEGRAANNGDGTYRYQYDLKDQLGNVRLTFQKNSTTEKADRVQSDNYYAFGMRKSVSPASLVNKYLYNGKDYVKSKTMIYSGIIDGQEGRNGTENVTFVNNKMKVSLDGIDASVGHFGIGTNAISDGVVIYFTGDKSTYSVGYSKEGFSYGSYLKDNGKINGQNTTFNLTPKRAYLAYSYLLNKQIQTLSQYLHRNFPPFGSPGSIIGGAGGADAGWVFDF